MLIIELEPTKKDDDGDNKWIFPKTLRPLTQEAKLIDGVVYDVVGRALFNPESQHFTARFSPDKVTVYHYDGMKHGGDSIRDNDMRIITHLAGPAQLDLKKTHTRAVVYHLRGGTMAQERFTRDQTLKIEEEFPIQLSSGSEKSWPEPMITQTGIDRIPDEDQFWLNNPHMPSTTDYMDKRLSQSGKERKSAGKTLKRKRGPNISPEEEEVQPLPCTETRSCRAPVQSVSPVIERQKKRACTLHVPPSSDPELEDNTSMSVPKAPPVPHGENPASKDVEMGDGDKSEFPFYCRCGVKGNGHDLSDDEQLGRWMHAYDMPSDEDTILDFQNVLYTPDIHTILLPHCPLLTSLLNFEPLDELDDEHCHVPAAMHVHCLAMSKKPGKHSNMDKLMMGGAIPDAGDLTPLKRAQIQNWFFNLVPGAKADITRWIGRVPIAHAFTVVLASWKADKLGNGGETPTHPIAEAENRALLWKKAWEYQCKTHYILMVDVDLESLALLEERMFENSKQAGIAGN
ncbi:hypothetical protein BDZ94DRAFT_1311935 [Collybia nuda]|uniref:Uncharacterized protein n=1 Tax=Collybia nuda TaxID=64659 RepID=A0A9P5XYI2_9AGAR|nr:hypothetical protein BDZ94DRAFT_1311935 [Collybia nuda]